MCLQRHKEDEDYFPTMYAFDAIACIVGIAGVNRCISPSPRSCTTLTRSTRLVAALVKHAHRSPTLSSPVAHCMV